jgi:hypothetical protein
MIAFPPPDRPDRTTGGPGTTRGAPHLPGTKAASEFVNLIGDYTPYRQTHRQRSSAGPGTAVSARKTFPCNVNPIASGTGPQRPAVSSLVRSVQYSGGSPTCTAITRQADHDRTSPPTPSRSTPAMASASFKPVQPGSAVSRRWSEHRPICHALERRRFICGDHHQEGEAAS